jgi:hypothetical protein
MEFDWKTVTAVWGAALSTGLALKSWLADRPLVTFEPTYENQSVRSQWFFIRIKNTTGRPLRIRRLRVFRPNSATVTLMAERSAKGVWNRWDPALRNDLRNIVLFPDQRVIVQLDLSDIDDGVLAYLSWDFMGPSFNLPRLSLIYRSHRWMETNRKMDFLQPSDY